MASKKTEKPKLDWAAAEKLLFKLTLAELDRVAATYKGEPFYGFAFDVNADYGDVLLCLNTPGALRESAQASATAQPPEWARELDKKLEKLDARVKPKEPEGVAHYLKRLRWSLGDWKYQGFESDAFKEGWRAMQDAIEDASIEADGDPNPVSQRFLISVCRVIVRMEKEKAFKRIPTARGFRTWVGDHDELDEWSITRLAAIRAGKRLVKLKSWEGVKVIAY